MNTEQRRIITLSAIGGMLEFYDFTIYGLFAMYFAGQFFISNNYFAAILASYSVFVLGYVVRPLGGIIFSHIGDEIGRKKVLIITMGLMGFASIGLGVLPTYNQIGILAPCSMIILRLCQGLAIGGELPSMIVYATESIPNKRGLAMGIIFSGTVSGLIPGMLINILITHLLTVEQINTFGWRIPFILGGLLCFIAYQIRRKLHETSAFTHLKQHNKFPLLELIRHHFGKLIIGTGLISIMATPIILAIIFMPTYLTKILKYSTSEVSNTIFFTTILSVTSTYAMGLLANRFSVIQLMQKSLFGIVISSALCYFMLYKGYNLVVALFLFTIFQGTLMTLPPILLSYLFPVQIRLTGVALSYNLAFVLFGGLTPIIVTALIAQTQMFYMTPFICVLVVSFISLIAFYYYQKICDVTD